MRIICLQITPERDLRSLRPSYFRRDPSPAASCRPIRGTPAAHYRRRNGATGQERTTGTYNGNVLLRNQLRGDRSAPVRRALQELDLRAESIAEVDAQHLFRSNGIGFEAQVLLPGIGRVDFLLAGFLIVEIDGFAFHSKRGDMLRDRHRNNTSTVQGFAVLRYMPEHSWFNPETVLAEIQAVLRTKEPQAR